ncbi:formylglycine-generating enzyme family protein [Desulfosarcina ovata]|uniref:Sulfatase-modifying factor enzyme-like domain-containing protein n=1 Tax=Desulfosarcina ovata subsp. ovata TaxID=2752305 RepID=A0A5K8AK58_9BACT|nr:SUMF1/EgtB/PvdO family nonheme iron enzyme [Desulfosarcina ovata]BBO92879.1 hypothetical protein DSCOOX_60590 [Desulfosarcina ovata subsp. ovata]
MNELNKKLKSLMNKNNIIPMGALVAIVFIILTFLFWENYRKNHRAQIISMKYPNVSSVSHENLSSTKWIENKTGIDFVWIPSAPFDGDRGESKKNDINELYIMSHEVTIKQFRFFINYTNYKTTAEVKGWSLLYDKSKGKWVKKKEVTWKSPGFESDESHPVVHVSYHDACSMAKWLSNIYSASCLFRLPTEAEWTNVCCSGFENIPDFSKDNICDYANVHDFRSLQDNGLSFPNFNCDDGFPLTAPIKSFKPNLFGIYDMIGNVWEWTLDDYSKYILYPISSVKNPLVTSSVNSQSVLRGGGWPSTPKGASCDYRLHREKDRTNCDLGFRLVMIPLTEFPVVPVK